MLDARLGKRNLAIQVLTLLVAPVAIWGVTSDPALLPQYLAWCSVLFLALGSLFWGIWKSDQAVTSLLIPKFFSPLLFFLCWTGISCTWARIPWEGFFEWSKFGMCAIWIWVLLSMRPSGRGLYQQIPRILLVMCGLALGLGYLQLASAGMQAGGLNHALTYQVVSFFAHRNLFAEALLLVFPFVFWLAIKDEGVWRILGLVLAFATVLMLVLLQVRSTWLGMAGEAAVGLVALAFGLWKRIGVRGSLKRMWVPIAILIAAATTGIALYSLNRQNSHPSSSLTSLGTSITNLGHGSAQERLLLWEKTFPLIRQRPLTGYGLGGWKVAVQASGYEGMRMDMQLGRGMFVRAHNDFLQLASETGILGGLSWLLGLIAVCWAAWRIVRKDAHTDRRQFAVIPLMSLMGYLVISCFSFPMERISHLILLSTSIGLIGAMVLEAGGPAWSINFPFGWRRGLCVAGMLLLLAFGYLGLAHVRADRYLLAALGERSRGNWKQMLGQLDAGATPFCTLDPTAAPYAWYAGSAKFQLGDAQGALQAFQTAYDANPYHLHVLNNLGAAWVQVGQPDSGIVYCKKAIALSPMFSEASLNLAIIYINLHKLDQAENVLAQMPDSVGNLARDQLAPAMVTIAVKDLVPAIQEPILQNKLFAISNTPAWSRNVFSKAHQNGRSLRLQLILESIFSLESQDKLITFHEANMLRQAYAPQHGEN